MKIFKSVLGFLMALVLTACGGRGIGLNTDFHKMDFQVNKSTKDDVISALGLPQKILKDVDGRDHYIYEGSTRLTGLCVGCGIPNAPVGLIPALINEAGVKNGAEYVFDASNILVAKFEPTRK